MIQAVSSEIMKQGRKVEKSRITGDTQWRTLFIGIGPPGTGPPLERSKEVVDDPQAYLVELNSYGVVRPHFHEVDQFQVFVSGNGSLGRGVVPPIALHYVDHYTAYGPITAGPHGLTLFTIRQKTDPGSTYLHMPGYRESIKPTKKRALTVGNIALSTEPVLQSRKEVSSENIFDDVGGKDGLGALILRLGAGMKAIGPDPGLTAGQYYLVVNGSLQFDGSSYPAWSLVYVTPNDSPLELCAGPLGVETLVLNFPRQES